MIKKLSESAQNVIQSYQQLPLGTEGVVCPYFKNRKQERGGLRVMVGKGTPIEIAEEVELIAKQRKVSIEDMTPKEIRDFMEKRNIGIDCSGFIVHVLAAQNPAILKMFSKRSFWKHPLRFLIVKLRPVENTSVKVLTSAEYSERVLDINAIAPGDLIRTRNGHHILLVTEVETEGNAVVRIIYTHSTSFYGTEHGIRTGNILITNIHKPLEEQDWDEIAEDGRNYTKEGYIEGGVDSGVFRIKNSN